MAIVKDYYKGNTHIIIDDRAYADRTAKEIECLHTINVERVNLFARQLYEKKLREGKDSA